MQYCKMMPSTDGGWFVILDVPELQCKNPVHVDLSSDFRGDRCQSRRCSDDNDDDGNSTPFCIVVAAATLYNTSRTGGHLPETSRC